MKKRREARKAAKAGTSELSKINDFNYDEREEARNELREKMASIDPHLYTHVAAFVKQYTSAILEKGGASGLELVTPALLIEDCIKNNKDKTAQNQARELVNQALYLLARDTFYREDLFDQDPQKSIRSSDTKACGEEVAQAYNLVQRNLQPFQDERDERKLNRELQSVETGIEKANEAHNEEKSAELSEKKAELKSSLKSLSKNKLDSDGFTMHRDALREDLSQHVERHNLHPEQTVVAESKADNTEVPDNSPVSDPETARLDELLKDFESPTQTEDGKNIEAGSEETSTPSLAELLGETESTAEETAALKETIKLGHLDNELEKGLNNFLKDMYENKEDKNPDFFTQVEKHFLALGSKIDEADLGFTHQDVKETFDRLKAFVGELESINQSPMNPMAKTETIAKLVKDNPSFYRDAANVIGYSNDLMEHFPVESAAFKDGKTGMGNALTHYTSKFVQWLPKYPLHLSIYSKDIKYHPAVNEKAKQLLGTYTGFVQDFNNATNVSTTRLNENYRRLESLSVKTIEVKTKTVSSKNINLNLDIARVGLKSFIEGKMLAEDKSNLVENIENVLWLYAEKLRGGTSLENKEKILNNIPVLMDFCQIVDPNHVNQRLLETLNSAITGLEVSDKDEHRDFVNLAKRTNKDIDDAITRGQKIQESQQEQVVSQLSDQTERKEDEPSEPIVASEAQIPVDTVEKPVDENEAKRQKVIAEQMAISIAPETPLESVAPPLEQKDPVVQEVPSVDKKTPSDAALDKVAEFKKNLGTEGSVMYHLRFGYRTATADMKPADYVQHLKECEPELYQLSQQRADRQRQSTQKSTPSGDQSEYRGVMRGFISEQKFGPILALIGTGAGVVASDIKSFVSMITHPREYQKQKQETQLRERIMKTSLELQGRVSENKSGLPGPREIVIEMTRPLYDSIQADLEKVGKPGTNFNDLRDKYSGSPKETVNTMMKTLITAQDDKSSKAREAQKLSENAILAETGPSIPPKTVTAVAVSPPVQPKNEDALNKLQAEYQQLNKELGKQGLRQNVREILEGKQQKIGEKIQEMGGTVPENKNTIKVVIIVDDTQRKELTTQIKQAGVTNIQETEWPAMFGKTMAAVSFSCDEAKLKDVATKLAQMPNPVDGSKIRAHSKFTDHYNQALQTARVSQPQETAKASFSKK